MLAWSCHVQECNSWLTKVLHSKSSESIFEAPAFLMSASSASSLSQIGHDSLQYNWQCNHNSWLQSLGMVSTHDRRVLIHHHPESLKIDSNMRFFCNSPKTSTKHLTKQASDLEAQDLIQVLPMLRKGDLIESEIQEDVGFLSQHGKAH